MFSNDKIEETIKLAARRFWEYKGGDAKGFKDCLDLVHLAKKEVQKYDEVRFWQEVEKEITHIARRSGII